MINTIKNDSTLNAMQRFLELTKIKQSKSLQKLASGKSINSAADNAAGLAILNKLASQISGEQQAAYNVQDTYSVAQVAEGGMEVASSIQQRLRELSVQSANGTLSDSDRSLLQAEADQLVAELDRFSDTVEFNGQKILDGSYSTGVEDFTTQAGANAGQTISTNLEKIDSTTLGLNNFDISTRAAAEQSIQRVDDSIGNLSEQRAKIGAYQNRLEKTYDFLGIQRENTTAAASRIGDTDYAQEIINNTKLGLLSDVNMSLLMQGNLLSTNVLALIK